MSILQSSNIAFQVATLNMKLIEQVACFSWLSMKNVVLSFKYLIITSIMFSTCYSFLALCFSQYTCNLLNSTRLHIQCCNLQCNIARLSICKNIRFDCKRWVCSPSSWTRIFPIQVLLCSFFDYTSWDYHMHYYWSITIIIASSSPDHYYYHHRHDCRH